MRALFAVLTFLSTAHPAAVPLAAAAGEARSIELEATVQATAEEIYRLFTTSEGVRTLFPGADARIETAVSGRYAVAFDPVNSPDGRRNGTAGCRILKLDPGRHVAFQWRGPEWARSMNVEPLPTWVEVDLAAIQGEPAATLVRLAHRGFGAGEDWDRSYDFFHKAWRRTLDMLSLRYADQPALVRPERLGSPETLWVFFLLRGPDWAQDRPRSGQPALLNHAAYLLRLMDQGVVHIAGPFVEDPRFEGVEAMGVLRVPDEKTAQRYLDADPAVQRGTLSYELRPWQAALPAGE